jgi:hypothetical protein
MKTLITTKVELKTHEKVYEYALYASIGKRKRVTLPEAYKIIVAAGLKALKGEKKSKKS